MQYYSNTTTNANEIKALTRVESEIYGSFNNIFCAPKWAIHKSIMPPKEGKIFSLALQEFCPSTAKIDKLNIF